jgi:hypothetical protein
MQELTDSIKRTKLRIMGIEEGEEVQAKGIHNIFNKIITENFPNLEKSMPIHRCSGGKRPRILYPAKLSFKIDGAIKVSHNKQKLKKYVTTKPPLQKILQGILHTESEIQHNHERAGSTKLQEKKKQESRE